jgi:hypothetical protein
MKKSKHIQNLHLFLIQFIENQPEVQVYSSYWTVIRRLFLRRLKGDHHRQPIPLISPKPYFDVTVKYHQFREAGPCQRMQRRCKEVFDS